MEALNKHTPDSFQVITIPQLLQTIPPESGSAIAVRILPHMEHLIDSAESSIYGRDRYSTHFHLFKCQYDELQTTMGDSSNVASDIKEW